MHRIYSGVFGKEVSGWTFLSFLIFWPGWNGQTAFLNRIDIFSSDFQRIVSHWIMMFLRQRQSLDHRWAFRFTVLMFDNLVYIHIGPIWSLSLFRRLVWFCIFDIEVFQGQVQIIVLILGNLFATALSIHLSINFVNHFYN